MFTLKNNGNFGDPCQVAGCTEKSTYSHKKVIGPDFKGDYDIDTICLCDKHAAEDCDDEEDQA